MKRTSVLDIRPVEDASPQTPSGASVAAAIDELMGQFTGRELVSTSEVIDTLLDLRLIATLDRVGVSRD